jgi:hypothetical protein
MVVRDINEQIRDRKRVTGTAFSTSRIIAMTVLKVIGNVNGSNRVQVMKEQG